MAACDCPVTAIAKATLRSQTCTGNLPIEFDFVSWNDPSFGYDVVSGGRATYITISKEGNYVADFNVFWNTDWTVGDFPYIEPSDLINSVAGTLVNDVDVNSWDDTQSIIYGEQFTAAESDHHQLAARVYFTFTEAWFGFPSIGIGVNMRSGATRTKNFGGMVAVTWLGPALVEQTIV